MLRPSKIILWIGLLAVGLQSARAFIPDGPIGNAGDAYQVPVIGYGLGGDIVAPKALGEEYRWNKTTLYYSCDQNFLDFFGTNGLDAVDQAIAIMNNAFTNNSTGGTNGVDSYSADLSEFPLDARQVNYTAQALGLVDLKSQVLDYLVEQVGLASPERYVWTLRSRGGNPCPSGMTYTVIKRNFDPVTFEPSSYVNGTLYTYVITEICTGGNPLAVTTITSVDPFAPQLTAVATWKFDVGGFNTSLTRDDVGGLRYLYRANNMNFETVDPTTTLFTLTTNTAGGQFLTTSNLQTFLELLPLTDPNTLLGLYPNLNITSVVTNYFITNSPLTFQYLTNFPWAPANFGSVAVFATQPSLIFGTSYSYTFGNVVTNHVYTNWPTVLRTNSISPAPFAPAGSGIVVTNPGAAITTRGIGGDFYILPPNVLGYVFQPGLVITNRLSITNTPSTNAVTTNGVTTTIQEPQTVMVFTNYTYMVYPIQMVPTAGPLLMRGMQKMNFVRRDFDSLIGTFFQPVTNNYMLTSVANNMAVTHPVQRIVAAPDILITAVDSDTAPLIYSRSISFNQANILPGLAGPGTIGTANPRTTLALNKGTPLYQNVAAGDENTQVLLLLWGSYDNSTNAPVVYPSGTSIANLENSVLMQVTSTSLPDGTNGVAYYGAGFPLTGSGGQAPYTWSLSPFPLSAALPPGLSLSPDGVISGIPTNAATFDFSVRMTAVGARTVDQPLAITIH